MTLPDYAMRQPTFPEMYERHLVGPLFRPWAGVAFDEAGLKAGDRVLDIACGTGIMARVAKERIGSGRIVGVDISPDMLAVARAVAPDIDWRQGSSDALPIGEEEEFDVVVCQQGLQFFPDKAAAAAQMHRALAQRGRLAVATWRSDEEVPLFRALRRVAELRLGAIADARYGFGEAGPLETLLRGAGFKDVRTRILSRTIRFEDNAFVRLNTTALVGMSEAGKRMSDQERIGAVEAIVRDSAPLLEPYRDGAGLAFEARTNLALARK